MSDTREFAFLPRKGRARKGWNVNVSISTQEKGTNFWDR